MKSFSLYKFNKMDAVNQFDALCRDGALIGERDEQAYNVLLYQLHSFYVEIYYHKGFNSLQKFRSFNSTSFLKPYLDAIDLEKMLA